MQKTCWKFVLVLVALVMATVAARPAFAQASDEKEKPAMYTYVAEWSASRADWAQMEKFSSGNADAMKKLMADGTIVGYGWARAIVHVEGAPTHYTWWSATSMASLIKALAVMAPPSMSGDQAKFLSSAKHWDHIMVTRQYANHSGVFENSFLRVGIYRAKPGEGETVNRVLKSYIVPVLDKLLADGAIHGYQIDRETVHTEDPGTFYIALMANGAEGLDKFSAALEAAGKATPTGGPAFGSAVDSSAHRDLLALSTVAYK
ncbi:MAG: hypothetical protein WBP79_04065 [Candidatus Acidiferrales bacterium]